MIKNYLKVAWRNLLKNKAHTFINIAGLSVGMAVSILIGLWIYNEVAYNHSFKNYDRLVQVMQHQTFNGDVGTQKAIPIPLGTKLRQEYGADFKHVVLSTWNDDHILAFGEKKIVQSGSYIQPEIPDMLSLNMIHGTRNGLKDMSSIMLAHSTAKALFAGADPMGKVIRIDNSWNVTVTGVYEDMPRNNSFYDLKFISPWDLYMTQEPYLKQAAKTWGNNSWQIFAQLNDNADLNAVSKKISQIKAVEIAAQGDKFGAAAKPVVFLFPMNRWHLYSEFKNGINTGGGIQYVWLFGIIGGFVLLLACINFMNLSTARSEKRAKEVGIRKTLGSFKVQLVSQFFSESLMVSLFAFFFSIIFVQLALSSFNDIADKQVSIPWGNPFFWIIGIAFSIFTGIIAGSYPAFYLSSFQPVKVLKGTFKAGKLAALPRKILVVLQFFVSTTLIIGTLVVFRQIQHTKNRPVGYERTGLIQIDERTPDIHKHFDAMRQELLQKNAIVEMAESGSPLTDVYSNNSGLNWPGKPPGLLDDFATIPLTPEFGKTAQWKIIAGRDFSRQFLTDSAGLILNEAAVKFMNFKDPIGQPVHWYREFKVIGVIKDMVMSSPYSPVKPSLFMLFNKGDRGSVVDIRVNPKLSMQDALKQIEATFRVYDPGAPFTYHFTDKEYEKKFSDEEHIGKLACAFTILAIFISCLGLFGMASFMAEQRTKEIGVRKVLGASVLNLWQLMSTEFVMLIVIALIIAIPVAYSFMSNWIKDYKYQTELSWWIFAGTAVGALGITLATVSYQSIRAALANPVKSLRSE